MSTTNGTRALVNSSRYCNNIYIGSFLNMDAVVKLILERKEDVTFVCSGTNNEFSLDDALCAGMMIYRVSQLVSDLQVDDLGIALQFMGAVSNTHPLLHQRLKDSKHYNILKSLGFLEDLDYCLSLNEFDIVPQFVSGCIVNTRSMEEYKVKEGNIDLVEYMRMVGKPKTLEEISHAINLGTENTLEKIKEEDSIVPIDINKGTYMYALSLPIRKEELEEIDVYLDKHLKENKFVIDLDLREYIDKNMVRFAQIIAPFTRYGWRNCVAYMLRDKYYIKNAIISYKGEEITSLDYYAYVCSRKKITPLTELLEISNKLKLPIPFKTVLNETVRINKDTFIRKDFINFDAVQIDKILEEICIGD